MHYPVGTVWYLFADLTPPLYGQSLDVQRAMAISQRMYACNEESYAVASPARTIHILGKCSAFFEDVFGPAAVLKVFYTS